VSESDDFARGHDQAIENCRYRRERINDLVVGSGYSWDVAEKLVDPCGKPRLPSSIVRDPAGADK
jgi:hypothetical protein